MSVALTVDQAVALFVSFDPQSDQIQGFLSRKYKHDQSQGLLMLKCANFDVVKSRFTFSILFSKSERRLQLGVDENLMGLVVGLQMLSYYNPRMIAAPCRSSLKVDRSAYQIFLVSGTRVNLTHIRPSLLKWGEIFLPKNSCLKKKVS